MQTRRTMRLLGQAMVLGTACGWMPLTAVADFSFEEMEQLERSEQGELLQRARQAANGENFGAARDYLERARHKGYAPDEFKAVEGLIAQREAAAEERRRQAEERRRREEEQRRLAELERQRANSASVSSGGGAVPWVNVDLQMVCGFLYCGTQSLSISGGPGSFSPGARGTGGIHDQGRGIAGSYSWSGTFEGGGINGARACSGTVSVSGGRRNLAIRVYSGTCADAGTNEY
ncbi:MAG: hypothetical protein H6980_05920 [Gammaproteobacteria bacterium]|nr:hypothetical protein [Gammaproteobacteria bacterium]